MLWGLISSFSEAIRVLMFSTTRGLTVSIDQTHAVLIKRAIILSELIYYICFEHLRLTAHRSLRFENNNKYYRYYRVRARMKYAI